MKDIPRFPHGAGAAPANVSSAKLKLARGSAVHQDIDPSKPLKGLRRASQKPIGVLMRRSHVGARRLPHVNELQPDVATFMIARAIAETYRDVLNEPVPEKLAAIIRQIQDKERGERVGQGEV